MTLSCHGGDDGCGAAETPSSLSLNGVQHDVHPQYVGCHSWTGVQHDVFPGMPVCTSCRQGLLGALLK